MSPQSPHGHDRSGYLSEDTIAAITTAVGGAIAMVRVSGPYAFAAVARLLRSASGEVPADLAAFTPRTLVRARLHASDGQWIDDALIARFVSPESYTGEDVVELHLHGSPFVANRVLESLADCGVRQALPGEFSFRAVRNGKMTLSQAQAVADLIAASNDGAVKLALEKASGTQNRLLSELANGLRNLAVYGEIGIDFADQDVDEVSLPALKRRLEPILTTLQRLHDSYARGIRLQDGVGVAFVGLPNAGKSSFFNALLGEDRSIVSEVAGTTRDVVRERLTLRGKNRTVTLRLEDTAGLRHTDNQIERMGIERSERSAKEADLLLFLVDSTSSIESALEQWRRLGAPARKTLGILTKCDLATEAQLTRLREERVVFGIQAWADTSAITGQGISEAVQAITEACAHWTARDQGEVLLTRIDQTQAVAGALAHLGRARAAAELDLFAADIRQALHALGPLIGETVPDDILGQIFSDFCIGK